MGRGPYGPRFPLLTKFIDASGTLPVHLHADDITARRLEGEPNGKTEAWHVLDAAPGATALVGVRAGVDRARLRRALLAQNFDAVLRRLPVRPGQTVYVPGGTLHSFGPGTLVYEIEQTSSSTPCPGAWPEFRPGLTIAVDDGAERTVLTAGPYFALERWTVGTTAALTHAFSTALVLTNAGAPVTVFSGGRSDRLDGARTLLLPAALGEVRIEGPADVLAGYVPDLARDIRAPLLAAGHGPVAIAALGEGLDAPA